MISDAISYEPEQKHGLFIPSEVLEDERLYSDDKHLLAVIHSLEKNPEGCFARNSYLAKKAHIAESTVSPRICRLKKLGWVKDLGDKKKRRLVTRLAIRDPFVVDHLESNQVIALEPSVSLLESHHDDGSRAIHSNNLSIKKSIKKEEERENLVERTTGGEPKPQLTPLKIFYEYFPGQSLKKPQIDLIEEPKELKHWRTAVRYWAGTPYRADNISGILDVYSREVEKHKPQITGMVVKEDGCPFCTADTPPPVPCPFHEKEAYNKVIAERRLAHA